MVVQHVGNSNDSVDDVVVAVQCVGIVMKVWTT